MNPYEIWLLLTGLICFGAAWVPHVVHGKPISFPIIYVGFGVAVFSLPLGLGDYDPVRHGVLTEKLTELIVIIALTGVGLKLDRPVGLRRWSSTWRLLGVTMPLSIAAYAFAGWWWLGLAPAAALLLGAVLAPTDPVLAAEVQAGPPMEGEDTEVRHALTSEAGLNDGLAFPFTNLAIAIAAGGGSLSPGALSEWLWYDVLYKVVVGLAGGFLVGRVMAWAIFPGRIAKTGEGILAVAITLVSYAATELLHGYGFLAVFVSAVTVRQRERSHEYHRTLHDLSDGVERMLMAFFLVLFGGALAGGLLASLTWQAAVAGLAFVFLVRPLAGWIGLLGLKAPRAQKAAVAVFGIRGLGSVYYLAYAFNSVDFPQQRLLWAMVAFVILISIVVHGVTASTVMRRIEAPASA